MQFLFVQSGFPLELPFPRFVTYPQLFFRSGIPHHRGSARTLTAVRISRRSYHSKRPCSYLHGLFEYEVLSEKSDPIGEQFFEQSLDVSLARLTGGEVLQLQLRVLGADDNGPGSADFLGTLKLVAHLGG